MGFFGCGWQLRAGQTKTHSRCQPWVLVKGFVQQAPTASPTTTATTSVTACDLFFNIAVGLYRFGGKRSSLE
jgi:hypothetical protein